MGSLDLRHCFEETRKGVRERGRMWVLLMWESEGVRVINLVGEKNEY